jgi:hypothetical protein
MNMLELETLRIAAQRGQPGGRLLRGLIWAVIAIFIISILVFLIAVVAPLGDPAILY